jgi:hypothetical protein
MLEWIPGRKKKAKKERVARGSMNAKEIEIKDSSDETNRIYTAQTKRVHS